MKKLTYVILSCLLVLAAIGCETVDTQTKQQTQPLDTQQGEYRLEDGTVVKVTPGQEIVYPDGTRATYMPDNRAGNYPGQTVSQPQAVYTQPASQQPQPQAPAAPTPADTTTRKGAQKGVVYPVGLEPQPSGNIQEEKVQTPTAAPQATIPQQGVVYPQQTAPVQQQGVVYPQQAAPVQQQGVVYPQQAAPVQQQGVVYPQQAAPEQQPGVVYPQQAAPEQQPGVVYPQQAAPEQQPGVVYPQQAAPEKQSAVQPQETAPQGTLYTKDSEGMTAGYPEGALVVEVNGKKQVYLPAKDNNTRATGQPQVVYPQ